MKVQRTRHAVNLFRTGKLKLIGRVNAPAPPDTPPRHAGLKTVDPGKVGKRGKAGSVKSRVALLHALANIEQWAYAIFFFSFLFFFLMSFISIDLA